MNVFISYAREDERSAKKLYDCLLSQDGVQPWLDREQLLPGVVWEDEIMKAMQQCHLIVLLLSSKSVNKQGYVQKEIHEALERLALFPPGRIFVVPARLNECSPNHQKLRKLNWVDLFPDWEDGFARILKVIDKERPSPPLVKAPSNLELPVIETLFSRSVVEARISSHRSLRGADMMDLDLAGLDFSGIDLSGANLVGCQLQKCSFTSARLRGANMERAQLRSADFKNADLWGVNFWRASLLEVKHLEDAVIEHTNFWGAEGLSKQRRQQLEGRKMLELGDYGTFVDYFRRDIGLTQEQLSTTFTWLNHHYFRAMFES